MNSGRTRLSLVAIAVATLTMLVATMAPAGAQTPAGAGTTTSNQSLLGVHVGDLLGLDVLTDQGSAVTKDALTALASISGVRVSGSLLPQPLELGLVKAAQPDGEASQKDSIDLANIVPGIIGGQGLLPLDVSALLGDALAKADGTASIANLDVLSGVLSLDSVTSTLAHSSATDAASVDRSLNLDALSLLNIGSLLKLLGVDVSQLGLQPLLDFLGGLGVALPGGDQLITQLNDAASALDVALANLQKTVGDLTQQVQNLLGTVLGSTPPLDTVVNTLIDSLRSTLTGLLDQVVNGFDSLSLIDLTAVNLGATAKAADTADASSASAACSVGSVKVASLAVDLQPTLDLLGSAGAFLSDLLSKLGLGIENLLNLSVCGERILGAADTSLAHDVTTADGVVKAASSASAIALSISPGQLTLPGVGRLCDLLSTCPDAGAASLPAAGGRAVAQQNPLDLLNVLTNGLSVNVGTVQAEATHQVAAAPAAPEAPASPDIPLARTGGNATPALLLAGAVLPLAILVQRVRRRLDESKI